MKVKPQHSRAPVQGAWRHRSDDPQRKEVSERPGAQRKVTLPRSSSIAKRDTDSTSQLMRLALIRASLQPQERAAVPAQWATKRRPGLKDRLPLIGSSLLCRGARQSCPAFTLSSAKITVSHAQAHRTKETWKMFYRIRIHFVSSKFQVLGSTKKLVKALVLANECNN